MRKFRFHHGHEDQEILEVPYRGTALLHSPIYNKGTGFTEEERRIFGLEGLLPKMISTLEEQVERVYGNIVRYEDPLQQYMGLCALLDRNETLYYKVLERYTEKFLPIVYTPTVGKACQEYSHIYRRGRGMWITPEHRGKIEEVLHNAPFEDVRLIVVTDNERILGLGDQGAGGMGIPVGKLALYTAGAGIHPSLTLPISLDVGTDNQKLLEDPLYLGYRHPRLRGEPYETLVEEFVEAVKTVYPRAVLQWEDFKKQNAFRLLDRYRHRLCCFNDDIQGTAAVVTAGVLAAGRVSGIPLEEQRIVIAGSGAAGVGIARQIRAALRSRGISDARIRENIALTDSGGFLGENRPTMEAHKLDFAWPVELAEARGIQNGDDLATVVKMLKPTVLLGTTGIPGVFTEEIVRNMAEFHERPAIFPLSNPNSKSEGVPVDLLAWTEGRALVATGSPFDPVTIGNKTIHIGQGNNAFVFPGVGLGALVSEASQVTDDMFMAACEVLAEMVTTKDLELGRLYPPIRDLRKVSREIAAAVVRVARDSGVGRIMDNIDIHKNVDNFMWTPKYLSYEPLRK
ncbi:MAG: NAD-dependent malic enzyme [Acidobacteriota bacterium]|nr:NAD-dependent malic enzyme [Acidobacteriota bacterium]